jgi:hypothetical protein
MEEALQTSDANTDDGQQGGQCQEIGRTSGSQPENTSDK